MKIARGYRPASFLLFFTLLASSTASLAQEQRSGGNNPEVGSSFPRLVVIDLRDVLGAPLSWRAPQWERFSLAVAGVGAAALLDRTVQDAERRDHSRLSDRIANGFEPLGSTGALGVLGSFYLVGLVGDDPRARSVAEDGLVASVIAGVVITPALKLAVGRARPREASTTFVFNGGGSFPSGHTTQAFAVASVIATHYDAIWVKGVAYGAAALVGFARIHHQAHFLSDVTAGALIGTVVGRAVVHRNEDERHRFAFAPLLGPDGQPGVGVALSF
jgi:hypothetical protein